MLYVDALYVDAFISLQPGHDKPIANDGCILRLPAANAIPPEGDCRYGWATAGTVSHWGGHRLDRGLHSGCFCCPGSDRLRWLWWRQDRSG